MINPRWKYCIWLDICFGVTWLHLLASTDLWLFNCPLLAIPQHTELWRRGKEYCTAGSYAGGPEVNPRSGNWQRWDLSLFSATTSWKSWDSTTNRLQYKFSDFKYTYPSADGLFWFPVERGRCVLSFGGQYCFHLQSECGSPNDEVLESTECVR